MWQNIFSILAVIAFSVFAIRRFRVARAKRQAAPLEFFGGATGLLADAHIEADLTAGSHLLTGRYQGLPVQVQTVTDTLAVRKLPSLWLMVTIPEPLPLKATFDLMMRPTGPTTFSNFDHLPVTIGRPPDFPEHAVVRTDDPDHLLPAHVVAAHLSQKNNRPELAREALAGALGCAADWVSVATQADGFGWREVC